MPYLTSNHSFFIKHGFDKVRFKSPCDKDKLFGKEEILEKIIPQQKFWLGMAISLQKEY